MATIIFFLLLLLLLLLQISAASLSPSPYLSPSTFHKNHNLMLQQLKIFIYQTPQTTTTTTTNSSTSLFHALLLRSPFHTTNPNAAHLFYLPLPPSPHILSSISRLIRTLRSDLPFWNRTLGADHFFLSDEGIRIDSDRNIVELRKNSIQISPFPTKPGRFIPHKDLTLPPPLLVHHRNPRPGRERDLKYLAFYNGAYIGAMLDEFRRDPEFYIETSKEMEAEERAEVMRNSRFCVYFYGEMMMDVATIGEAMGLGCVPVVVSSRLVLDLPFGDVIRWSEVAVFVGPGGIRKAMGEVSGERYRRMREVAVEASVHFRWSTVEEEVVERRDAFHTVVYQLWLRRHVIRYARREWER